MSSKNEFDEKFLEEIAEETSEKTEKEVGDLVKQVTNDSGFAALQSIARKFLDAVAGVQNTDSITDSYSKLSSVFNENTAEQLYQELKNRMIVGLKTKELIKVTWELQNALNLFLGRDIILTIVDDEGNLWLHSAKSELDLWLNSGSDSNRPRINLSQKKDFLMGEGAVQLSAEYLNNKSFNGQATRDNLLNTYKLSMERYRSTDKGKSKKRWIWYHANQAKRTYLYVSSAGIVGEAYVSALFTQDEKDSNFMNQYHNEPGLAYFYYKYCLNTDNRAGLVLGDIANDPLSQIQLAIKRPGASSESFGPLIKTAQYIVDSKSSLTKEDIANFFLEREADKKEKVFTNAKQISKKVTSTAYKELQNTMKTVYGIEVQ